MRPLRRYKPPKPRDHTQGRKAVVRQILLAGAISALIISGYLSQGPPDVPITLQGPLTQSAPGSCESAWRQAELDACWLSWWMLEPHDSLSLTLELAPNSPAQLTLERTPPAQVQSCVQAAMSATPWPQQSCSLEQTLTLPPA